MPLSGSWKSIKISPGSHKQLMAIANHFGCSIDTILHNMLERITTTGEIKAGNCIHCHQLFQWNSWNELDGVITTKIGPHHEECFNREFFGD